MNHNANYQPRCVPGANSTGTYSYGALPTWQQQQQQLPLPHAPPTAAPQMSSWQQPETQMVAYPQQPAIPQQSPMQVLGITDGMTYNASTGSQQAESSTTTTITTTTRRVSSHQCSSRHQSQLSQWAARQQQQQQQQMQLQQQQLQQQQQQQQQHQRQQHAPQPAQPRYQILDRPPQPSSSPFAHPRAPLSSTSYGTNYGVTHQQHPVSKSLQALVMPSDRPAPVTEPKTARKETKKATEKETKKETKKESQSKTTTTTKTETKVCGSKARREAAAKGSQHLAEFDQTVQLLLMQASQSACPMGFRYYHTKTSGGYLCGGGSHFVSDEEVDALIQGQIALPYIEVVNSLGFRSIAPPKEGWHEPMHWDVPTRVANGMPPMPLKHDGKKHRGYDRVVSRRLAAVGFGLGGAAFFGVGGAGF